MRRGELPTYGGGKEGGVWGKEGLALKLRNSNVSVMTQRLYRHGRKSVENYNGTKGKWLVRLSINGNKQCQKMEANTTSIGRRTDAKEQRGGAWLSEKRGGDYSGAPNQGKIGKLKNERPPVV